MAFRTVIKKLIIPAVTVLIITLFVLAAILSKKRCDSTTLNIPKFHEDQFDWKDYTYEKVELCAGQEHVLDYSDFSSINTYVRKLGIELQTSNSLKVIVTEKDPYMLNLLKKADLPIQTTLDISTNKETCYAATYPQLMDVIMSYCFQVSGENILQVSIKSQSTLPQPDF